MQDEALQRAKILIVDDEAANVHLLERLLRQVGYTRLRSATDPRHTVALFVEFQPDLILLDLLMPHLDGFAVIRELEPLIAEGTYLPILVLTADITPETKRRALAAGAKDFLTKPFDVTEILLRVKNLLDTRFLALELQSHNERLEAQVRERTQQLLQTEKLAAMGQLLAGVAHELNNPLSVVTGRTALLRESVGTGPLADQAEKIARAADRCARIVKNFLALARQRPAERQAMRLNQVVEEAVELLAYPLRLDSVEVRLELAPLPVLWADPHQLHQVVVNLVSNAHQAMRETSQPRRLTLVTRSEPRRARVLLEVGDTGPGIPLDIQPRVFEPFFTTKPPGQGTGLGLSLCRGIVETHGGSILVESQPGQGSTFLIELPVEAPLVLEQEPQVAESSEPLQARSILIVDDEPEVAGTLADLLHLEGHRVETAANGAIALDKLGSRTYDLVISDIKMPELDGPGLYRALRHRDLRLLHRFIFLTGDALSQGTSEFLDKTGVPTLSKPFALEEVRRAVRRALRA